MKTHEVEKIDADLLKDMVAILNKRTQHSRAIKGTIMSKANEIIEKAKNAVLAYDATQQKKCPRGIEGRNNQSM